MEEARFEAIGDVLQYDLFLPFELSLRELMGELSKVVNEQEHTSVDGGPGSGRYPKGSGEKGKKKKCKKSLKETEKSGNLSERKVSAQGRNEFKVKGFVNKQKLNNHWQNGRTHQKEYERDGIFTKEQYEARALELVQSACGRNIVGYKTRLNQICRYDKEKNDFVKGHPDKGIYTMFKPEKGLEYYEMFLESEGVIDDE